MYYLKEKIGKPELFVGRKKEFADIQEWIDGIEDELSMSLAILARRKTGKTAFLQRVYNLALIKSDIIQQGGTNFVYRGVQDNIFDKVFRGVYQQEIDAGSDLHFDAKEIRNEYKALFEKSQKNNKILAGKYSQDKGIFAEYAIINRFKFKAYRNNELTQSITENLPDDFEFVDYQQVWGYTAAPVHRRDIQIDLYAKAKPPAKLSAPAKAPKKPKSPVKSSAKSPAKTKTPKADYTVIGEVKNRENTSFSLKEAQHFAEKMKIMMELEKLDSSRCLGFVFSLHGFTEEALEYLEDQGMAWSEDDQWLD